MVKAIVILFAYFSCWTLPLIAQSSIEATSILKQDQSSLIKQAVEPLPLSIGDKMPDIAFNMLNYKKPVARMSDFKGKLVLLDFWATWCGSCIGGFPKLDSLQDKFGSKLQVILVNSEGTGDDQAKVATFIKKRETVDKEKFPFAAAAEDKVAVQLFPHEQVPHYVWISPDGIVKAITSSRELTAQNIQKVLSEESIALPVKRDFFPDKISGFGEDILIDDDLAHFSFFKKGRMDGWVSVNELRRIGKKGAITTRGILMRNMPLLNMFQRVIGFNKEYDILNHDPKRMIIEIYDSSKLFFKETLTDKETWDKDNLYSYDIVVPASKTQELYEYILQDLNRYSEFHGRVEKRKIKCWLLVETGKDNGALTSRNEQGGFLSIVEKDKVSLKNTSAFLLARSLNLNTNLKLPVINQANNSSLRLDIILDRDIRDIEILRKQLNAYGLDIRSEVQELEMFVITQKRKLQ
jgi:thiol-disulfide isomerase/thioredoxin